MDYALFSFVREGAVFGKWQVLLDHDAFKNFVNICLRINLRTWSSRTICAFGAACCCVVAKQKRKLHAVQPNIKMEVLKHDNFGA